MLGMIALAFGMGAAMRFGMDIKDDLPDIKEKVEDSVKKSVATLNDKLNKKDDK